MSNSIETIEYLDGQLGITLSEDDADQCLGPAVEGVHPILIPWWGGSASRDVENLETILTYTTGTADILLTWENDSERSGYRVTNGNVVEHEIIVAFGNPVAPTPDSA